MNLDISKVKFEEAYDNTRRSVEYILGKMKDKLEEKDIDER